MKRKMEKKPKILDPYRGGLTTEELFALAGGIEFARDLAEATGIPLTIDDVPDSEKDE